MAVNLRNLNPIGAVVACGWREALAEAYRRAREAFKAADLQNYAEPHDDGVPAEDNLREMEKRQARFDFL